METLFFFPFIKIVRYKNEFFLHLIQKLGKLISDFRNIPLKIILLSV